MSKSEPYMLDACLGKNSRSTAKLWEGLYLEYCADSLPNGGLCNIAQSDGRSVMFFLLVRYSPQPACDPLLEVTQVDGGRSDVKAPLNQGHIYRLPPLPPTPPTFGKSMAEGIGVWALLED